MRTIEHPLVRAVKPFVPDSGVLYSLHDFEANAAGKELAVPTRKYRDYLRHSGVDPGLVGQLLNRRGELVYRIEQDFDIRDKSPEAIAEFICGTIELPMKFINPAIAGPSRKAINNHDLRHARRVWELGDGIMQAVGTPLYQRQAGAVALLLHDIGNMLGRSHHPPLSVLLRRLFYPNMLMSAEQEEIVDEAILIHDGDLLYEDMKKWGNVTLEEACDLLACYGDVALSLIFGDKLDIGLHRLPSKDYPLDLNDYHRIVNLYVDIGSVAISDDLRQKEVVMVFGKPLTELELEEYSHFLEIGEDREIHRKIPEVMRERIEYDDSDQYSEARRVFWEIYFPRMMLTVISSFSINPLLETMTFRFENFMMVRNGYVGVEVYQFDRNPSSRSYMAVTMKRIFDSLPDESKNHPHYNLFARFCDADLSRNHTAMTTNSHLC